MIPSCVRSNSREKGKNASENIKGRRSRRGDVAAAVLQDRKGANGVPVANLTEGQAKNHAWIDEVLDEHR